MHGRDRSGTPALGLAKAPLDPRRARSLVLGEEPYEDGLTFGSENGIKSPAPRGAEGWRRTHSPAVRA